MKEQGTRGGAAGRFLLAFIGAAWIGSTPAQVPQGAIRLNEILAENRNAVVNGSSFPDYIELVNPSSAAVSLTGLSLTDDPAMPRRFTFPDGALVQAGGHVLVWCDSEFGAPGMHTGFALSATGERVQLYAADGASLLDEINFGLQIPNLSIGRIAGETDAWVLTEPSPGQPNVERALGSRSDLRINEWMARPSSGHDWIELFNPGAAPVSLAGVVLTDSTSQPPTNRPIPELSFIAARGFVPLFASDLDKLAADHLDFRLGSGGETLTLFDVDRSTVLDRVVYLEQVEDVAQGRAPDGSDQTASFPVGAATPGRPNVMEMAAVVISEILSHTDPPLEDAIELQNVSDSPVDISHWWLSDSARQPRKYRIPNGTVIPANAFAVFYEYQFGAGPNGFSLDSAEGDKVFLSVGNAAGDLVGQQTFVEFGALRNGIAAGRFATSVGVDFVPLESPTFGVNRPGSLEQFRLGGGESNAAPRVGPVVISEISIEPAGEPGLGSAQFIELHNVSESPTPLYDVDFPTNTWRLSQAIGFSFPFHTTLAPSGTLLVVSFDPAGDPAALTAFRTRFAVPDAVPVFGPFKGQLASSGERLELLRPDEPEGLDDPNAGFVPYELVESIAFAQAAPWPVVGSGSGLSLQRRVLQAYGNEPLNWSAALPTPGKMGASDADQDGLPDDWELAHGLSPTSGADAAQDPDGDGHSSLVEFHAGTDPQDPLSVLRFTAIRENGGMLALTFTAMHGKSYLLEAADSLHTGSWLTVTNVGPTDQTGPVELAVPAAKAAVRWFRVTVPSP